VLGKDVHTPGVTRTELKSIQRHTIPPRQSSLTNSHTAQWPVDHQQTPYCAPVVSILFSALSDETRKKLSQTDRASAVHTRFLHRNRRKDFEGHSWTWTL